MKKKNVAITMTFQKAFPHAINKEAIKRLVRHSNASIVEAIFDGPLDIGIVLKSSLKGGVIVERLRKGSSAEINYKHVIKKGMQLLCVDNEDVTTRSLDNIVEMISTKT